MSLDMSGGVVIRFPRDVAERLRREARRRGLSLEEYVFEMVFHDMDPPERARSYIEAAVDLLEQAEGELREDDVRQAAERVWGAAALAVKAYAEWKEGRRLTSHGELWEYKRRMESELGGWVFDAWSAAQSMHTCFYDGWCSGGDVEEALKRVRRLVSEVERRVCV